MTKLTTIFCLVATLTALHAYGHAQSSATWQGGPGLYTEAMRWDPVGVPSGNVSIFIDADPMTSSVLVPSSAFINVTNLFISNGDSLIIGNQTVFRVLGDGVPGPLTSLILNNGTIMVEDATNLMTSFRIDNEGTELVGSGRFVLNGDNAVLLGDGNLINHSNTICGFGQLNNSSGAGGFTIDNLAGGIIDADVTQQTLRMNAGLSTVENKGVMQASNGGILELFNIDIANNGGVIQAQDDSFVRLGNILSIRDGILRTFGDGLMLVETAGNGTVLTDTTIAANVLVTDSAVLFIERTDGFSEEIRVVNSGSLTRVSFMDNTQLCGFGTILLDGSDDCSFVTTPTSGTVLTNLDCKIMGQGNVGGGVLKIVNEQGGLIEADVTGETLKLDPGNDPWINRGMLRATQGSNLSFSNGLFQNSDGQIIGQNQSTITLDNLSHIRGGELVTSDTSTIEIGSDGQAAAATVEDVTLDAILNVGPNDTLNLIGTITNNGTINLVPGENLLTRVDIEEPATVVGPGTINLLGAGSTIFGFAELTIDGGTVTGIGDVRVDCTFRDTIISPGNSVGTLKFSEFNQTSHITGNSVLRIELGSADGEAGIDWDLLDFNGQISFQQTGADQVVIELTTLDETGLPGPLAGFDQNSEYYFEIASVAGQINDFRPGDFSIDTSQFDNAFNGQFSVTVGPDGSNEALIVRYGAFSLGDVNMDGNINLLDVDPFISAVSSGQFVSEADINADGVVNLLDVAPFITLLSG